MVKKKDKKKWLVVVIILIAALLAIFFITKPYLEASALSGGGNQPGGNQPGGETPGGEPTPGEEGPWCSDHDAGLDFGTSSWCEDSDGRFLQDYCSGANILEAYCDDNDECKYYSHACIGTCVDSSCSGERPSTWSCCYYSKGYQGCYEGNCPAGWQETSSHNSETECEAECGGGTETYYCCASPGVLLSEVENSQNPFVNFLVAPEGSNICATNCVAGELNVGGPWSYDYCTDRCTSERFCDDYCYGIGYDEGGSLVGMEGGCYPQEVRVNDCCCFNYQYT